MSYYRALPIYKLQITMKKNLLAILLLIFICFYANAQKLEKPIVDKITGDTTLATKSEVLQNKFSIVTDYLSCNIIKFSPVKIKGFYNISFKVMKGLNMVVSSEPGNKAIFKLKDGRLIEVSTKLQSYSSYDPSQAGGILTLNILYELTDEDVINLKSLPIAVIRLETSKGPFDYELSGSKAEIIKKQLDLVTKK